MDEYINLPSGEDSAEPVIEKDLSTVFDAWLFGDCKRCRTGRACLFAGLLAAFSMNCIMLWVIYHGM